MAEQLFKLSPHRDLQSYFYQPSAIAALSGATESGFTLSGTWRQQFDWAVVEWNRDNVFEHPALRCLPDGDLSGLTLSYIEQRTNCLPIESDVYPSVEWPYLRLWAEGPDGNEHVYYVRLKDHAAPVDSSEYRNASATLMLTGSPTQGKAAGVCFEGLFTTPSQPLSEQHFYYMAQSNDSLADVARQLAANINSFPSFGIRATSSGPSITFEYAGAGALAGKMGSNANRVGVYGYVDAGSQLGWTQPAAVFSGGGFPVEYQVSLDFGHLQGAMDDPGQFAQPNFQAVSIPTQKVRKLRWTWAADLQPGSFERVEFSVVVSNWTVAGNGRQYFVAGPGSRRIEDDDPSLVYSATGAVSDWTTDAPGNYSGSRIHLTRTKGAACSIGYSEPAEHQLYLGARALDDGAIVEVSVDDGPPQIFNLGLSGEDVLLRLFLGSFPAGPHTVAITHSGAQPGSPPDTVAVLYFDFLEVAYPSADLPDFAPQSQLAVATDWDTLHSQSLPAERTAWLLWKLGFHGRVNHYVGAIWYYELFRPGHQYAQLTVTVTAPPGGPAGYTELDIGGDLTQLQQGTDPSKVTIQHQNLAADTDATIAQALALLINRGSTAIWASANGNIVTITARAMGTAGNGLAFLPYSAPDCNVVLTLSSNVLAGGIDGVDVGFDSTDPNAVTLDAFTQFWRTDLNATPRLNRACRDWCGAFFRALVSYGIDCVASFSTELAHVDPRSEVGMAQRYSDDSPVVLNTPAVQTNFSPASLSFWQEVYLEMAALQTSAGLVPYLQSGEVQWWYFAKHTWQKVSGGWVDLGDAQIGMPFYDDYTKQQFAAIYGRSMKVIQPGADPVDFPSETAFLPTLIGAYTAAIRNALKQRYANARFEVLYPTDVNNTPLNLVINYPVNDWTPQNLSCLKTEGLSYTAGCDLDAAASSIQFSAAKGFSMMQRSHLVGIGDRKTAWMKESNLAQAQGLESVVLFALDQFCLIGYPAPPFTNQRWSRRAA